MALIGTPLGYIMYVCYLVVKNYGIALILFTLVTKLILFPLSVKQQKNSARMAKFNPKMEQLRKKYGNNKEKLNEEMMKLYSEENYNPMGSCLPLIVTMVILFGLIDVVYKPLSYIIRMDKTELTAVTEFIENDSNDAFFGKYTNNSYYESRKELYILEAIKKNEKLFTADGQELYFENYFENSDEAYKETILAYFTAEENSEKFESYISDERFETDPYLMIANACADSSSAFTEGLSDYAKSYHSSSDAAIALNSDAELFANGLVEYVDGYAKYRVDVKTIISEDYLEIFDDIIDFDNTFLGFDMGVQPTWNSIYVLIPIISLLANFGSVIYTQRKQKKLNPNMQSMGMGMNAMIYTTPLLSFFIAFSVPAGVGFYWILSSVFSLFQSMILYNVYTPERVEKMVEKETAKKKAKGKQSFYEKALEVQQMQKNGELPSRQPAKVTSEPEENVKKSKSELKEEERRKLNEARKRMAEKYGDEYTED